MNNPMKDRIEYENWLNLQKQRDELEKQSNLAKERLEAENRRAESEREIQEKKFEQDREHQAEQLRFLEREAERKRAEADDAKYREESFRESELQLQRERNEQQAQSDLERRELLESQLEIAEREQKRVENREFAENQVKLIEDIIQYLKEMPSVKGVKFAELLLASPGIASQKIKPYEETLLKQWHAYGYVQFQAMIDEEFYTEAKSYHDCKASFPFTVRSLLPPPAHNLEDAPQLHRALTRLSEFMSQKQKAVWKKYLDSRKAICGTTAKTLTINRAKIAGLKEKYARMTASRVKFGSEIARNISDLRTAYQQLCRTCKEYDHAVRSRGIIPPVERSLPRLDQEVLNLGYGKADERAILNFILQRTIRATFHDVRNAGDSTNTTNESVEPPYNYIDWVQAFYASSPVGIKTDLSMKYEFVHVKWEPDPTEKALFGDGRYSYTFSHVFPWLNDIPIDSFENVQTYMDVCLELCKPLRVKKFEKLILGEVARIHDRITDISNEIVERENDEKSAQAQKLKEQEEIERQAERKSKRVFIALMVFALCLFTSSIGSLFYPFKNPLYKLIAASSTMVVGLLTLMGRRRATWLLAVGYLGFLLVLIDLRVTGWILWPAYLILAYYVWETD